MTTCPQTVHGTAGLLRGRRSKSAGQAGVGATVAELIDTIEGRGDAAFRLRPGGTASDRRVLWTWHGLAERLFGVPPVRNLKIIT